MIKVLHVVSALSGGGVEAMLYNYYINMDRYAIKFDFIVHDPEIGMLEQGFSELGSKIYHITPKKVSFIKNIREMNGIIKSGNYDIIHCHQNLSSLPALYVAKRNHIRIRIAHSHTSLQDEKPSDKIIMAPLRTLLKHYATDFFACSEIAGKWLFGDNKSFFVLNNAIDIDKFLYNDEIREKVRNEYGWNNKLVAGNVARFFPEKNHEKLIEIFNEIHKADDSAVLVLVGDGPLEEKVKLQAEKLELSDSVFFLGRRNDVNRLMQAMDIFIFPSCFEGLGIVLIEAQAAGLKCYASKEVPKETHATDLIEYISIEEASLNWAKKIISTGKAYDRVNTAESIKQGGFDINNEAKKLEQKYISLIKNHIQP